MCEKKSSITIKVRSYVSPDRPIPGFRLGEAFKVNVKDGLTLKELLQDYFSEKAQEIGIMAVNGKLVSERATLSDEDSVDLFVLLDGG